MRTMQQARPRDPQLIEDFFVYSTGRLALAAAVGATAVANISIQADSDFQWEKSTHFCDAGAYATESTRVIPLMSVQIQDTGSGRNMFNTPISIVAISGPGQLPFILSRPKIFDANSVIQVTFVNLVATATNIELALSGRKRFRIGN